MSHIYTGPAESVTRKWSYLSKLNYLAWKGRYWTYHMKWRCLTRVYTKQTATDKEEG